MSTCGKIFNEQVRTNNLFVVNNLDADPTTHCELKTHLNRCLDIALVNNPRRVMKFKIDHEWKFSPFSVKVRNGEYSKCFTDHKALIMDYDFGDQRNNLVSVERPLMWKYDKLGDLGFNILTDDRFDYIVDLTERIDDVNMLVQKLDSFIKKCKSKSYHPRTFTNKYLEEFRAEEIWKNCIDQILKIEQHLGGERENNKIY